MKGAYEQGLKHLQKAVQLDPENLRARHELALTLSLAGRLDDAINEARQILHQDPDNPMVQQFLSVVEQARRQFGGQVEFSGGRFEEAIRGTPLELMVARSKRAPEISAVRVEQFLFAGTESTVRGDYEQALQWLKRALDLSPGSADIHTRISAVYDIMGDFKEAERWIEKALALDPDFPRAHYSLGLIKAGQGDQRGAMAEYRKAIEHYSPRDPEGRAGLSESHNNLGVLLWEMGERDEAISHWRKAVRYDPSNDKAQANLRHLGRTGPRKKRRRRRKRRQ